MALSVVVVLLITTNKVVDLKETTKSSTGKQKALMANKAKGKLDEEQDASSSSSYPQGQRRGIRILITPREGYNCHLHLPCLVNAVNFV